MIFALKLDSNTLVIGFSPLRNFLIDPETVPCALQEFNKMLG